jgi:lipoprotein NlpD
MSGLHCSLGWAVAVALVGALLPGCASKGVNRAPVEDRGGAVAQAKPVPPAPTAVATPVEAASVQVKPLPGSENAGKPGYYIVKPGDTLIRIGLDHGQGAKDIARWSGIDNPNRIEVGQVLRVEPPLSTGVAKPVVVATASPVATPAARSASADKPVAAVVPSAGDEEVNWIWPAAGAVLSGFDEQKNNKGLDIAGVAGEPVLAAADGRVVYVGAAIRGYGNLIIVKHNNTFVSAYAHNQTLLVKDDQMVRKGQKIAEMGSSDTDRVKLHFELRRKGKPVDPAKYLPAR